jgi:hypothetical protein
MLEYDKDQAKRIFLSGDPIARQCLKEYFTNDLSHRFILRDEDWNLVAEDMTNLKDFVLRTYYDIDNIEQLLAAFHPTNDMSWILEDIPGLDSAQLEAATRRGTTSFESFQGLMERTYNFIEEVCPEEFFVYGGLYIEKMDGYNLIDYLRSFAYKLGIEEQFHRFLVQLYKVFDHLSPEKLYKLFEGVVFEKGMIMEAIKRRELYDKAREVERRRD